MTTPSELDRLFPRPTTTPEPEPPPDPGVIQGVKRPRRRRYVRRWYRHLHTTPRVNVNAKPKGE
jgi:hypothetical protein